MVIEVWEHVYLFIEGPAAGTAGGHKVIDDKGDFDTGQVLNAYFDEMSARVFLPEVPPQRPLGV